MFSFSFSDWRLVRSYWPRSFKYAIRDPEPRFIPLLRQLAGGREPGRGRAPCDDTAVRIGPGRAYLLRQQQPSSDHVAAFIPSFLGWMHGIGYPSVASVAWSSAEHMHGPLLVMQQPLS